MSRTLVVWDPRFREYDFGPGHPFTERSRDLGVRLLKESLGPPEALHFDWMTEVDVDEPLLSRFHSANYIEFVRRTSSLGESVLLDRGDTPSFTGCFPAAARLATGADRAVRHVLENGSPGFHPAGGLHHAGPSSASGFCIFNDVAIAIATALDAGRRVAYIDIDAHHGDGVMYGFYNSGRVLDIDFHQDGRTLFPGTGFPQETGLGDGAGLKVNVPLPPGAGDEAFLPLFRRLVGPLLEEFGPDLVVLQHGVDAHWGDPLTRLQYTPHAYGSVVRDVLGWVRVHGGNRLLVTGGGGYRAESVSRALAASGRLLGGLAVPADDAPVPPHWREEFRTQLGTSAPTSWADRPELPRSPWRKEDEGTLVGELEKALGRRFPSPGPSAGT